MSCACALYTLGLARGSLVCVLKTHVHNSASLYLLTLLGNDLSDLLVWCWSVVAVLFRLALNVLVCGQFAVGCFCCCFCFTGIAWWASFHSHILLLL